MAGRTRMQARLAGTAGAATIGLLLVACGNDAAPGAGGSTRTTPSTTTSAAVTPSTSMSSKPSVTMTAVQSQTPAPPAKPVRLTSAMLLTGAEVAKSDPGRNWAAAPGRPGTPICGRGATAGSGFVATLSRSFSNELDASGGQWLTSYRDARAAKAAYGRILATIRSCKAAQPAPTHARKVTEDRAVAAGDATRIVRWYDYPLPSDLGSEDGGFPFAITRSGSVVSVLAFREMGKGIKPVNFERMTRTAAAHLPD